MNHFHPGWFCQLDSFRGQHRVYFGDLSYLSRYLLQDPSVGKDDLPQVIGFRTEGDWKKIIWNKNV
jgi:hypothetical protein